jgi:thioredoxin 2
VDDSGNDEKLIFQGMFMNEENIIVECRFCGADNKLPVAKINRKPRCGSCKTPLDLRGYVFPEHITDVAFQKKVIESTMPVLVVFWAPWSSPCGILIPILEELSGEFAGRAKIAKLNVVENPLTTRKFMVQKIPTLMLFKSGLILEQKTGTLPKETIRRWLSQYC